MTFRYRFTRFVSCERAAAHPGNVASRGPDIVHVQTDSSGTFGDERTLLECVVDTLNTVTLHRQQEATVIGKLIIRNAFPSS